MIIILIDDAVKKFIDSDCFLFLEQFEFESVSQL